MSDTGTTNEFSGPEEKESSRRKFLKKAAFVGVGAAAVAAGLGVVYELNQKPLIGPPFATSQIKHWIMIMQENRTFSTYFTNYPGANSSNPNGVPTTDQADCGANHSEQAAADSWNNGTMSADDFIVNEPVTTGCPASDDWTPLHYYPNTVPGISDYWTLASEFVLFDNFFASWMGYSLPAHLVNISGNVCGDNPLGGPQVPPMGSFTCPTMPDRLNAGGISWRYYGTYTETNLGYPASGNGAQFWCVLQYWHNYQKFYMNNCVPNTNILTDVSGPEADFPIVAWVCAPPSDWSEHPPAGPEGGYQNWTGPIISKIMANTELWNSCAILLCWDDYGGYYDPVPPPYAEPAPIPPPLEQAKVSGNSNRYYYGFRVPALMISPYAKKGFVDNTQYDFTSFLRTLEVQYNLPSLNGLDSAANDFLTHTPFDFKQGPRQAQGLKSFHTELAAKTPPKWLAPGEYKHVAIPLGEEIEND